MAATTSPNRHMQISNHLLKTLGGMSDGISFKPGATFSWSPRERIVRYNKAALNTQVGIWSLIHETAHALLGHQRYEMDFDLLTMEVEAWERAKMIAQELDIKISEDHIQDCLDTYRDWLHRRSTCPTCGSISIQSDHSTYNCQNCNTTWHVSSERFCRPYRLRVQTTK